MIVIRTRSPFFVEVNEPTQTKVRFKIYVCYLGDSIPVSPTYELVKPIVSTTDRALYLNISPYVEGFLNAYAVNNAPATPVYCTDSQQVVQVKVETQYYNGTTWSANSTNNYIAVDGYTDYGANQVWNGGGDFEEGKVIPLIKNNSLRYGMLGGQAYGFNVLIEHDGVSETRVTYNGTTTNTILDSSVTSGIYNMIVPFDSYSATDAKTTVFIDSDLTLDTYSYTIARFCEQKYTPVLVRYVNKFGGWDYIYFLKTRKDALQSKNETYSLNQNGSGGFKYGYDYNIGQNKTFNHELKRTIKLSTGWVDESFAEQMQDLMVSKRVYMDDTDLIVKTQSIDVQTKINEKLINYVVEFEVNHNLINDMQ